MPHALMAFAACLLLAADEGRLQGTWRTVSVELEGEVVPEEVFKDDRLIIEGDAYRWVRGDRTLERGTMRLDPTKAPASVDFSIREGEDAGRSQPGIYKFEGETWTLCVSRPGSDERPTEFVTKPGSGRSLSVWRRTTP